MKGDCYCSSTTVTTTAGTDKTTTAGTDVTTITATAITMVVVTATAGTATTITAESENGKWRNLEGSELVLWNWLTLIDEFKLL